MRVSIFGRLCAALCVLMLTGWAAHAGPLDPPAGPIAPTMKTLDEVEARTPVQSLPGSASAIHVINQPGSYYLTGNITGEIGKSGVRITANDVTLDLNGFSLIGVTDSLHGVHMPSFKQNVVIRNGNIRVWDGDGVQSRIDHGRIEGIIATANGGWGIDNAVTSTFSTVIARSEAYANRGGGIRGGGFSLITDCVVWGNTGTGAGVLVGGSSSVVGCTASFNTGTGIETGAQSSVIDCNVVSSGSTRTAISIGSRSTARDNSVKLSSSASGILVGTASTIDSNTVTSLSAGGFGIRTTGSGSIIIRNTVHGMTLKFDIAAGNSVGPIADVVGVGDMMGAPSSEHWHPWANFAH